MFSYETGLPMRPPDASRTPGETNRYEDTMDDRDIAALFCEESQSAIYACDPDSYELVYLNRTSVALYRPEGDYHGQLCFRALHDRSEPCPFCTMQKLSSEGELSYGRYDERLDRHFLCRDKLVDIGDGLVRLQIANDSTLEVEERRSLEARLAVEKTLVQCAQMLSSDASGGDGLNDLLRIIGEFYDADRAYLLESSLNATLVSNTVEWCADGVEPQIDFVQNVPLSEFQRWTDLFDEVGMVRIVDLEHTVDHDSMEYEVLAPQGITDLLVAPLYEGGGIMSGMLGIDNPHRNIDEAGLLRSLTYFVQNDLEKRRLLSRLGELSHTDGLTGVGNRNSYIERLVSLVDQRPQTFGVVFADINDLKLENDTRGHSFGDAMIRRAGQLVRDLFPRDAYRIGGDEFVAFCVDATKEEFDERVRRLSELAESDGSLTISVGSSWSDDQEAPGDLVIRADRLMYEQKRWYHRTARGHGPGGEAGGFA